MNFEELFGLHGESIKCKPPFVGDRYGEGPPSEGVSLRIGVEVRLLFKLKLVTSDKSFADLERSKRGLLADLFSGDPLLVPGKDAVESWNISRSGT